MSPSWPLINFDRLLLIAFSLTAILYILELNAVGPIRFLLVDPQIIFFGNNWGRDCAENGISGLIASDAGEKVP